MTDITIFTKPACANCVKAKQLLQALGIKYVEFELGTDIPVKAFRVMCPGVTRVPQIYDGDRHIGGYAEFAKYVREGGCTTGASPVGSSATRNCITDGGANT